MDTTSIKNKSDDVRVKNYASIPTLEDKVDKEKLPAILQVYIDLCVLGVLLQAVYECIYIHILNKHTYDINMNIHWNINEFVVVLLL